MNGNRTTVTAAGICCFLIGVFVLGACKTTQPARVQLDDAGITTKIKAKLAADGEINPFNVDVTTNEGVVTLQGRLKNEESRTKVEKVARETEGVVRVIDLIKVGEMQ